MLTSENLPQMFHSVKDPNENFIWIGEPSFIPFVLSGVPYLVLGLAWGAFAYFGFIRHMKIEQMATIIPFFALHLLPFYGSILNMFRLILVHKNTYYAITDKRIMMRSGFFGIDFKSIDFDKISDIEVNVNPVENMLGVGTIRFYSGRTTTKGNTITDNFLAIPSPYEVYKKVKTVTVDVKTDWNYPNKLRPEDNSGYQTKYKQS